MLVERAFRIRKKKKTTASSSFRSTRYVLPPHWLVQSHGGCFLMHAHAFMPHIGFADKNRGKNEKNTAS